MTGFKRQVRNPRPFSVCKKGRGFVYYFFQTKVNIFMPTDL